LASAHGVSHAPTQSAGQLLPVQDTVLVPPLLLLLFDVLLPLLLLPDVRSDTIVSYATSAELKSDGVHVHP
jgi:hypothetical protein